MSEQYPGGYMTRTPPVVTSSSAPGMWTLSQQAGYQKQGVWPQPSIGWMGAFTSGDTNTFYDLQIDSSGNIYAVGWSSTSTAMVVAKFDKNGNQQWVRNYSTASPAMTGPADTVGSYQSLAYLDSSDNLFFGYAASYNGGGMIKINSSGTVQSNVYVNPGFLHVFLGIKGAGNSPYLSTTELTGSYRWSGFRFNNALSTSPTTSWAIQGGSSNSGNYCIGLDSNAALWGSGQTANGDGQSMISKGATAFYNRYQQSTGAVGNQGGGCVMVGDGSGNMYHTPVLGSLYYIIKWNTSGGVSWAQQVTGAYAQTQGGAVDSSDNLYLTYYPSGYNGGQLLKLNSSGSIQMQQRFSTSTNCTIFAVAIDPNDSSIVMAGNFGSTPRAMILRIPPTGANGTSWTVGGATLSCATSTVFSLSSVSFTTSSLSQNSYTPASPTTNAVTTATPTPTWSKFG